VCGRFTSSQRREALGERFEVAVPEAYQHRFNLAPQQRTLIVRERDAEREAVMAKWGLLPHWAKDSKIAFKMINARAETLTEKPAYRSLIGHVVPCVVPRLDSRAFPSRKARRTWSFAGLFCMGREGFEPSTLGLRVPCSTN
jgi:putative SOS response-associated peptidase YedK